MTASCFVSVKKVKKRGVERSKRKSSETITPLGRYYRQVDRYLYVLVYLYLGRQIPICIGIPIPRQIDTCRYRYTQNHLIYVSARRFLFTFTRTLPKDLFIKRRLEIAFAEETSFKVNERIIIIIISNRFNQIALKYLQPKAAAAAIFIASNRYLGSRRFASNT